MSAADRVKAEHKVKAAYLLSFAKFVKWPEGAYPDNEAPLVVATYGKTAVEGFLRKLPADKRIQGRKIVSLRLKKIDQMAACHIVFVAADKKSMMKEIRKTLSGKSVLLVGNSREFCKLGASIGFLLEKGRVKFAVNPKTAKAAGLEVSSRLLKLGEVVE